LETEVVEWANAVHAEGEQEQAESHETKLTSKLIDYIHGKQWTGRQRYGRSRPVVNRMFRHFIEQVGLLTDLELDFKTEFHDATSGHSELQDLCNKMILDWVYDNDFEMALTMVVMWGLIHTGPVKIQWNPLMANGMGDVEFQDLSPLQFMMLGTASKPKDSEACIVRRPVTLAWLKRRYGAIADSITPDRNLTEMPGMVSRPAKMSNARWQGIPKSVQRMIGIKGEAIQS